MLLLPKLTHPKGLAILVNIVQHVSILVPTQPFVLPVKSEWLLKTQEGSELLVRYVHCVDVGLGGIKDGGRLAGESRSPSCLRWHHLLRLLQWGCLDDANIGWLGGQMLDTVGLR